MCLVHIPKLFLLRFWWIASQCSIANKISSVVVDNCSTNDAMMGILGYEFEPKSLIGGAFFTYEVCLPIFLI